MYELFRAGIELLFYTFAGVTIISGIMRMRQKRKMMTNRTVIKR